MKIVVCIKQVPLAAEVSIDPATKRLQREGVESGINPFDLYAVEEALRIREQCGGGEVIILCMGPGQAEKSVREALSMGADRGILLSDPAFAGSDTWATSYILARAIDRIGQVEIVFCGKQAVDGDTAQVGPELGAQLQWPHVTYVIATLRVDHSLIQVRRMHENGYSEIEMCLPALLTVVKDINQPRVPTLPSCRASRAAEVTIWNAAAIAAEARYLGLTGSPTRVVKTGPPPARPGTTMVLQSGPRDTAKTLIHELRMKSLV